MSGLRFWTSQIVLEYSKAEDILSFLLVCKQYKSFCDEKSIKPLLSSRFKEIEFDLDFDKERRKVCKIESDIHWLLLLEKNWSLIMKNKGNFTVKNEIWWVLHFDTFKIQLSEALQLKLPLGLPDGFIIISVGGYNSELDPKLFFWGVIGHSSSCPDSELWLHYHPPYVEEEKVHKGWKKASLPAACKSVRTILLSNKRLCLLSDAGVVWHYKEDHDSIVRIWLKEPVFKEGNNSLLSVTGNSYHFENDEVINIEPQSIKFTDVIRKGDDQSNLLTDKYGNIYERQPHPFGQTLRQVKIEKHLPPSFIWKHWTVDSFNDGTSDQVLTLISDDLTVWQWNLRAKAILSKSKPELHAIGNLKSDKSSGKVQSCAFQNVFYLFYLAESGTLYCSCTPDMLKQNNFNRFSSPTSQKLYVGENGTVCYIKAFDLSLLFINRMPDEMRSTLNLYVDGPKSGSVFELYVSDNQIKCRQKASS
eukprot:Platyproteum_vivax@DN7435_c4_g1_i6.p1